MKHSKAGWGFVLLISALAMVLVVALTGCGSEATTTTADTGATTTGAAGLAQDQTLRMNIGTEPPSIDPNQAVDIVSINIINNVFEGLVHVDKQGVAYPGVAEKWETSEDGLTVTFYLRGTDRWTNGDTVTSQDFKDSWLRILDPETAAEYAYMLYCIKGAEEYNSGRGSAEALGIDASDPKVLKVELVSATPWFVPMVSHQAFFPIPKKVVEQYGDRWTEPENIVTNGPYELTVWNHESDMTLEKWADHRMAADIALQTIKLVMVGEATTGVAAFEAGEIDIQDDLPPADMVRLKALPEFKAFETLEVYYYGFNVKHAPLDKAEVRKALALAIDRQSIVDNISQAGEVPATSFTPPGMPGWDIYMKDDLLKPTADMEAAKILLAEAGYADPSTLPEIVIYYNDSDLHKSIATAIQEQWKQLGVKAALKSMEARQYFEFIGSNDEVMVFRASWIADFPDAYTFLDMLRGAGGNNATRWASAAYDKGLEDALQATDDNARYQIYSEMEQILQDEMPIAPIYWRTNPDLVKTYVQGYEPNPANGLIDLWTVQILRH